MDGTVAHSVTAASALPTLSHFKVIKPSMTQRCTVLAVTVRFGTAVVIMISMMTLNLEDATMIH